MSTTTTNYGLIKPDTTDPILIGQLNDNADIIDATLKSLSDVLDVAKLGIKYKGEVNYYSNLPASGNEIGDAYTVKYAGSSGTTPDGTEYVWGAVSGVNQWINFSKDSYSKAEVDALLALKQNVLSSAQLAAANSGIDSEKVAQIETNKNNISLLTENGGGKNLLNHTATTQGIWTVNSDGTITATGTGTATLNLLTIASADNTGNLFKNCILTGCPNVSGCNISIERATSPYTAYAIDTGNGAEIDDIPASIPLVIFCRVGSGTTVNNTIFKPMISKTGGVYQPYAMSNAELTAAIQALQAQLANQ